MPKLDLRLDANYPDHPKIIRLVTRLGPQGIVSHINLLCYARRVYPCGKLKDMDSKEIELASRWNGPEGQFTSTLTELKLLDQNGDGYEIHDWSEHNTYSATAPLRSEAARIASAAKWGRRLDQLNKRKRHERVKEARTKGRHTNEEWKRLLDACDRACVKCGSKKSELVKDHIVPMYQGGSDAIENIQPMCRSCNAAKGPDSEDYRPKDWFERLRDAYQVSAEAPSPYPSPSPYPYPYPKEIISLSNFFVQQILAWKSDWQPPTKQTLRNWQKELDLMVRKDHRSEERIRAVIEFVTHDDFEQPNVMSVKKLRQRFDALEGKMRKQKEWV